MVEIGTAKGGTLYSFCQVAAEPALVISIDLPGGKFGVGTEAPSHMALFAKEGQTLQFLRCDAHEDSTKQSLLDILAGRPIEFLFIDGDHTYEGVKTDFEMYSPLVRPGGVVAFHDIVQHRSETGCEVDRFWNEIKSQYAYHEFVDPRDEGWGPWGGIGAIEIPSHQ